MSDYGYSKGQRVRILAGQCSAQGEQKEGEQRKEFGEIIDLSPHRVRLRFGNGATQCLPARQIELVEKRNYFAVLCAMKRNYFALLCAILYCVTVLFDNNAVAGLLAVSLMVDVVYATTKYLPARTERQIELVAAGAGIAVLCAILACVAVLSTFDNNIIAQGWLVVSLCADLVYTSDRSHQASATQDRTAQRQAVIITDIGRDADDTIALLVAVALKQINVAAIITTGGKTVQRARLVRYWLRKMGVADDQVAVVPDGTSGSPKTNGVFLPSDVPSAAASAITPGSASDLLVDLARLHKENLVVLAIGPMAALAAACSDAPAAMRRIGGLGIQGQAVVTAGPAGNPVLAPDFEAFNLREDRAAAAAVFGALQNHVPFTLVGKHAAYAVKLVKPDLEAVPGLLAAVKRTMEVFQTANPKKFWELYPVPAHARTPSQWWDAVPGDKVVSPYDPLLVMAMALPPVRRDELFAVRRHGRHATVGNAPGDSGVRDADGIRGDLRDLVASHPFRRAVPPEGRAGVVRVLLRAVQGGYSRFKGAHPELSPNVLLGLVALAAQRHIRNFCYSCIYNNV